MAHCRTVFQWTWPLAKGGKGQSKSNSASTILGHHQHVYTLHTAHFILQHLLLFWLLVVVVVVALVLLVLLVLVLVLVLVLFCFRPQAPSTSGTTSQPLPFWSQPAYANTHTINATKQAAVKA